MRPVLYVLTFLAVMALAFWAYRENYATQHVLKDVTALQNEIADLRDALSIQQAEWAYLNRPDRLAELASINFDRLGLMPLQPEQFAQPEQVAYPPVSPIDAGLDGDAVIEGAVNTSGTDEVFP